MNTLLKYFVFLLYVSISSHNQTKCYKTHESHISPDHRAVKSPSVMTHTHRLTDRPLHTDTEPLGFQNKSPRRENDFQNKGPRRENDFQNKCHRRTDNLLFINIQYQSF